MCVAYIDARDVMRELDAKFGEFGWTRSYNTVAGRPYCSISVKTESGQWIERADTGEESNIAREKGLASDAFKRAAVNFGIGRDMYEMEPVLIPSKEFNGKFYPAHPETGKFLKGEALSDYCNGVAEKQS